jgi:hypothetical protein
MRSIGLITVGAIVGLSALGCGSPTAEGCPRAIGVFHGSYTYLDGNCGASLEGRALLLEKDDPGNTVRKVNNLSDSVITEINLIGCSIGMKQEIISAAMLKLSDLQGDLEVEDESALSGVVEHHEYMPDGSTVRCTGHYNATYTLDNTILGGAAEHALGAQ